MHAGLKHAADIADAAGVASPYAPHAVPLMTLSVLVDIRDLIEEQKEDVGAPTITPAVATALATLDLDDDRHPATYRMRERARIVLQNAMGSNG